MKNLNMGPGPFFVLLLLLACQNASKTGEQVPGHDEKVASDKNLSFHFGEDVWAKDAEGAFSIYSGKTYINVLATAGDETKDHFNLRIYDYNGPGAYKMIGPGNESRGFMLTFSRPDAIDKKGVLYQVASPDAEVVITHFDPEKKVISGTFDFDVKDFSGRLTPLSNGRFEDVPLKKIN